MSNPEDSRTPPLTRRQMREIRNTGSTPIVTPDMAAADDAERVPVEPVEAPVAPEEPTAAESSATADEAPVADDVAPANESAPEKTPSAAPLAREAAPSVVPSAPRSDASVDLGVSPLTRRAAREQERIRTASIPVITPDAPAATVAAPAGAASESPAEAPATEADEPETVTRTIAGLFDAVDDERPADQTPLLTAEAALQEDDARENAEHKGADAGVFAPEPAATVSPQLGSALLEGAAPEVELPPSFDHLLTRDSASTGSSMAPNALILSQTPSTGSLTSPIAATGEVLITGTFALPEGLGSHGHAPGTTDGKEADAILVDGELPASSSPTPIAASAAISTVRSADEIIRPPAPEKGSRLMLTLAITAGALALALVGVLILAVATGAFA
ncbi:hypothetical protein [Microbacterium sp. cx-59]|uniref:hypothetical protein n=1 Tax=Microbacterium sp. cx-59 TaxID=2891207 RepID=UPI001E5C5EFA|nr:hypothetical protein [Microbacterium sp. cx-59]MCC4907214.1 hypothetical protein [Microbacterium sp. cx-59]